MAFMAAALPYLMAASAVISAVGAMQQGQAAKSAADYNATINAQNADVARQNASDQAHQQERDTFLRLGAIRAAQGHSGGDSGQGSVLDVLGDVAAQSELDKQYTLYQGEQQARGYTNTAQLDTFSGQNAETTGYLKAGSELLGSSSKYAYADSLLKRTN
jgi:hypothetical protein